MKNMKLYILLGALIAYSFKIQAQSGVSIDIDGLPPHTSAMLDVISTEKGFLPPRLTSEQRDAIINPAPGLMIYNTSTNCLNVFNSPGWFELCGDCTPEPVTADAGPDQIDVEGETTVLQGNNPGVGSTGTWSVISSTGGTYSFSDVNDPEADFTGDEGITYNLQWEITNPCSSSSDEVQISFSAGSSNVFIPGNPLCDEASEVVISATPCSSVPGAVENNDPTTTMGTEYDWADAISTVHGVGFGAPTHERALVEIGGQCWTRFNVDITPPDYGISETHGWYGYMCTGTNFFCNNNVMTDPPTAGDGMLYQWRAALNGSELERAQGVCPDGWHVPSDCEWMYLENTLGMTITDQIVPMGATSNPDNRGNYGDGTSTGSRISTLVTDGNNESGFTAFLGGQSSGSSSFNDYGDRGNFWSSTINPSNTSRSFIRQIRGSQAGSGWRGVGRHDRARNIAMSVRCLKN